MWWRNVSEIWLCSNVFSPSCFPKPLTFLEKACWPLPDASQDSKLTPPWKVECFFCKPLLVRITCNHFEKGHKFVLLWCPMVSLVGLICKTNSGWWFGHPRHLLKRHSRQRQKQILEKSGYVVLHSRLTPHLSLKVVLPELVMHCWCEFANMFLFKIAQCTMHMSPCAVQKCVSTEQCTSREAPKTEKLCGSTLGWILTWLMCLWVVCFFLMFR